MAAQTEFVFITYTDRPDRISQKPFTKDVVRKQAMRAFNSSQGSDLSAERQRESDALDKKSHKRHMNRFRLAKNTSRNERPTQVLAPRLPAKVYPFDPFVSSLGPKAWELLDYFRFCFRMKSMSIHESKEWFRFTMYQSSISQATLCLVSLNRDLEAGSSISSATLHHRVSAMKLLQEEINDSAKADRDVMAGTVALLAIAEDTEGNLAGSRAHMNGMMRVVESYGGLSSFSKNKAVLRLIAWADFYHASTWLSCPRLPGLMPRNPVPSDRSSVFELSPLSRLSDPAFRSDLEILLCPHLRSLIDILHQFPKCAEDAPSYDQWNYMIHIVEQLMINLRHRIPYEGQITALARAFIIAAQLYLTTHLKQLPAQSAPAQLLQNDLLDEIERYQVKAIPGQGRSTWNVIVLWIQVVCYANGSAGVSNFHNGLHNTMRIMDIGSECDLGRQLSHIAWSSTCSSHLIIPRDWEQTHQGC